MKYLNYLTLLFIALIFIFTGYGQVSGNINYHRTVRLPDNNINIAFPNNTDLYIDVKGLANVKANNYTAVFSLTQTGKSAKEVNELISNRIESATADFQDRENIKVYIDMISFVPLYEYEVEKKIFSKNTYNEIPAGFELKKNIHIAYKDPDLLNDIIAEFAKAEIYNLVRVDYFADNTDAIKTQLMSKAKDLVQQKIKYYEGILGKEIKSFEMQFNDGYKVVYPVEMYRSYQAYNNSSLNIKKRQVNNADKDQTQYYQPVFDKEFDFVIDPSIIEPVIQVMYEIKIRIIRTKEVNQPQPVNTKQYMLVTPNGDIKTLPLQ